MRYAIKIRELARGKAWWFLAPGSDCSRLRVHAVMFDSLEKAERVADEVRRENQGVDARVVQLKGRVGA